MNYPILIAGVLIFLAFLAHLFIGSREALMDPFVRLCGVALVGRQSVVTVLTEQFGGGKACERRQVQSVRCTGQRVMLSSERL